MIRLKKLKNLAAFGPIKKIDHKWKVLIDLTYYIIYLSSLINN